MEVRDGYKQTEGGVIPSDWECRKLCGFCEFTQGVQLPQTELSKNPQEGFIRYLYIRDFFTDDFPWFVENIYQRKIMKETDIMMVNTGNTAGQVYSGRYGVLSNNAFKITFDEKIINRDYLYVLLRSYIVQNSIQELFNSSGQPHVGHKNIAIVSIPLPSLPEQTAIAIALSDADALIQSLEKLIAKKRSIKQGAMQELLKPKEGWVVKKLGEIGIFKKGKGIKKDEVSTEGYPCIRYGELYTHHDEYIKLFNSFINEQTAKASQRINKGDILFAGSGETKEEIGKCAALVDELIAYAGGDVIILTPIDCDSMFLGFLLNHSMVAKQKAQKAQGDAVVHIYPSGLSEISIHLPPKSEQTRIATILSDMDAEVAGLETKLAKYKQVKQGITQELLTGRTRLV